MNADECGAPEFFTGGAKLIDLEGKQGKLHAADLERELTKGWTGVEHHVQPAAVSVTQASEAGTVYTDAGSTATDVFERSIRWMNWATLQAYVPLTISPCIWTARALPMHCRR